MAKPYIEYHYTTHRWGSWGPQYEQYPVGTTFAQVKAEQCPNEPTFTPLRLRWPSYVWPGGYELYYLVKDGGVLCHQCANAELDRTLDEDDGQFCVVASDANYEDPDLYCNHCNRRIQSSYAEDQAPE